jgi:ADP-ribose pyrophosphatase
MKSKATSRTLKTIHEGRIFRVERDEVRMPTGRTVTMDIIRHRGSVVMVPEPRRGEVILIRQFRYVINRWIWELPAGSLEPGEQPARAARRECEEEIGWRPRKLERLGMYYPTPGFCDERMIFFACRDLVRPSHPPDQDLDEQIEPRTFTMREAWELVRDGEVVDMKTVVGLALVAGRIPVGARGK